MTLDKFLYLSLRLLTYPLVWAPYRWIHGFGHFLGSLGYYLIPKYRKRALSNLALAKDLRLSFEDIPKIAKQSIGNLMINCLEYAKFFKDPYLNKTLICENPEKALQIIQSGQGIVFFCGHQANWEALFLEGTQRMPGVAIGRPINNQKIYGWITSIRERFGGTMITPRQAIKEGLRALKQGKFLGIVGDQGMPESGFHSLFLGLKAWTSPVPALLSYKTSSPLLVATTRRKQGKYYIRYSDPIYPDQTKSSEEEVPRLMNEALRLFETSVKENPGQWMWLHNRWKQETPKNVFYRFRHESILTILPNNEEAFHLIERHLTVLKDIYPLAFLSFLIPLHFQDKFKFPEAEILFYATEKDMFLKDYRFKMVFNFTTNRSLDKHFKALSAFEALHLDDLKTLAEPHLKGSEMNLSEIIKRAICRKGTLWS